MKNKSNILSILLVLLFSFSCSKDEESDVKDYETIGLEKQEILNKLPDGLKQSNNEYAQMAVDCIESTLDWSAFSSQMTPPENAVPVNKKSGKSYTWTWNYGNESVTMWWTYSDDEEKNYWDLDIQYGEGERYNYIQAFETKDENLGQIRYNFQWACAMSQDDPSTCENLFWIYSWELDENENFTGSLVWEAEEEEHDWSLRYETVVNNDGSGWVKYYFYEDLWYDLNWDTQGNGSWVYYLGDQQLSGSWTID